MFVFAKKSRVRGPGAALALLAASLSSPARAPGAPPTSAAGRPEAARAPARDMAPLYRDDLRKFAESERARARPAAGAARSSKDIREEQERALYQNPPFRSGEGRRSTAGVLDTSLTAALADRKAWRPETYEPDANGQPTIGPDGRPVVREPAGVIDLRLRSYDGLAVGPTLRVKPGDLLRVRLKNRLPVERPGDHSDPNRPNEFNRTNLHTHGLHVSPVGNSDNVLLEVRPGEDFTTEVAVPSDHIPGTFWYHAHVHGSTAMQVSSGMAGALIVEPRDGDPTALDAVPGIAGAEERIFLFQQISFLPTTPDPAQPDRKVYTLEDFEGTFGNRRWPRGKTADGWRTTINGQLQPVIRVKSGRMQRFRFIHGGIREPISVQIAPLPGDLQEAGAIEYDVDALNDEGMREIALDGIPLDRIRKVSTVELFPGYRSDALVRLSNDTGATQRYVMWDGPNSVGLDPSEPDSTKAPAVLAFIEVEPAQGEPDDPWPSEHDFAGVRRPAPIPDHEVLGLKAVQFNLGPTPNVNGQPYDPAATPMIVKLGRADEWRLRSGGGNHPFHIHVNPFFVVSDTDAAGVTTPWGVWRDTLIIQAGRTYDIRTRYERYIGDFVIHCHILDHEDTGMMMGVRVVNAQHEVGTQLAAPYLAPLWTLPDADGEAIKLEDQMGDDLTVVVYLEDQGCAACNEQLKLYGDRHRAGDIPDGVKVVFVAPGAPGGSLPGDDFPFKVAFDADLGQFKAYGAYLDAHEAPLHGTFVLDKAGRVRWREVSDRPFMDLDTLIEELELIEAAP